MAPRGAAPSAATPPHPPPSCGMYSIATCSTLRADGGRGRGAGAPGADEGRPRQFSSRHVPHVAEEITHAAAKHAAIAQRLEGLTRLLKSNSAWEDDQKTLLACPHIEDFVPEDFDEVLRAGFERLCGFGERLNSDLMSSAKWIKLLREAGIIGAEGLPGTVSKTEADLIFKRVVHCCNHGGQRLTYELFCKALCLLSQGLWPEQRAETSLRALVARIVAAAPAPEPEPSAPDPGTMLNANVLLVIDFFKPALIELFQAFCSRNLPNPCAASPGKGFARNNERTIMKLMQDGRSTTRLSLRPCRPTSQASQVASPRSVQMSLGAQPGQPLCDVNLEFDDKGDHLYDDKFRHVLSAATTTCSGGDTGSCLDRTASVCTSPGSKARAACAPQFVFANGSPIIAHRRHNMSLDQLLTLCREMNIMPDLMSRLEVARLFKRVLAATPECKVSSLRGYLSCEAFIDAMGQLALEAYTKEPYNSEYPEPHEKIHAFLSELCPGRRM